MRMDVECAGTDYDRKPSAPVDRGRYTPCT